MMVSQDWKKLGDDILSCRLCPCRESAIQPVLGEGNLSADLMFIGRAPGVKEDLDGHPFVGPSGDILDVLITAIKLNRDDCYVSNMIKCYPYGDRVNTDKEIDTCFRYIGKEIELVSPKVVVVMGAQTVYKFLSLNGVAEAVKCELKFIMNGILYVPSIHPSATLKDRSGKMRRLWTDHVIPMVKDVVEKEIQKSSGKEKTG